MDNKVSPLDINSALTRKIWRETGVASVTSEDLLAWLANNPIEPTLEQVSTLVGAHMDEHEDIKFSRGAFAQRIAAFQRIAYLIPEPVYPTEIHQKMWTQGYGGISKSLAEEHNTRLKEAFELGKTVWKMDEESK